jgi:hypothetical protein
VYLILHHSGYTFVDFYPAGVTDQCVSALSAGQVVRFATYVSSAWKTTTSTVPAASFIHGIQVNGWIFPETTTGAPSSSSTGSNNPAAQTSTGAGGASGDGGLTPEAKIGLGVGLSLGVVAIAAALLGFFFYRRRANKNGPPAAAPFAMESGSYGQFHYGPYGAEYKGSPPPPSEMASISQPVEIVGQYPPHEMPVVHRPAEMP